jgi:hypothetical protein
MLLHYYSTTTPLFAAMFVTFAVCQCYCTTTALLHYYYSTTTPLLLHYYSTTTPLLLHYYSTTTPLLLHYYPTALLQLLLRYHTPPPQINAQRTTPLLVFLSEAKSSVVEIDGVLTTVDAVTGEPLPVQPTLPDNEVNILVTDYREAGSFQFGARNYDVAEVRGAVVVDVVRNQGMQNTVHVTYRTVAGTALGGGVDYIDMNGTLTFEGAWPVVCRLCAGCVPVVCRLCAGCVPVVCRLCAG